MRGNIRSGFSLTELLVVIAIIILLAALLFPSLRMAKEAAYTVRCASNLRQIAMSCGIYSSQYRGALVPRDVENRGGYFFWYQGLIQVAGLPLTNPNNVNLSMLSRIQVIDQMDTYIPNMWGCIPSIRVWQADPNFALSFWWNLPPVTYAQSEALHSSLDFTTQPPGPPVIYWSHGSSEEGLLTAARMKSPARTATHACAYYYYLTELNGYNLPTYRAQNGGDLTWQGFHHSGKKAIWSFADGHVEAMTKKQAQAFCPQHGPWCNPHP